MGKIIKILVMMNNSECLVLQNSEFAQNHVVYYRELMEYQEMTDITLACDDDSSIKAHKFILCASSPFFRNIIRNSRHQSSPHVYVYLKGVHMDDLQAVVTFMYTGETKVKANDIKRFLTTAHELKVAGLIKNKEVPMKDTLTEEMEPEESKEIESMIENMEQEFEVEGDAVISDVEPSDVQENDVTIMTDESINETENVDTSKRMNKTSPKEEGKNKTVEKKKTTKKEQKRKEKIKVDPEVLNKEMESRLKYVFDKALQKPVYVCTECDVNFTTKKGAKYHVELHLSGAEEPLLKMPRL